jgi:arylsulfatase A-like enzyme
MPRPKFFISSLFILSLLTFSALTHTERPNVILIMTDDQGYGDFGVMGNALIDTPNFDAMAERSASMSTFYVNPVCSPTRTSLMTGRYNLRTRCIDTWLGRSMMDTEEVTVAEVLKEAGYATGIFGKWHLGDSYPMRTNDQGFDESLVHRGGGLAQPADHPDNAMRYTDPYLYHNGEPVKAKGYCTDVYFDAAMQYMEQQQAAKKPFFAYIATNAPHNPLHDVPEDLRQKYMERPLEELNVTPLTGEAAEENRDKVARIFAMIENTDQNMGRLFDFLNKQHLTENTLVIYMNDNGPYTMRFVGPFRGKKTDVLEGGVRSPMWLHWPSKFKAGTTRDHLTANIDVMPTILDVCNVPVPEGLKLDGRSFLPVLENKDAAWDERSIVMQSHRGTEAVKYNNFMIRNNRYKLVNPSGFQNPTLSGEPKFELYDLQKDPSESNNIIEKQTFVATALKAQYDTWFEDVSTTRENNFAPPLIHAGTPHENPTSLTRQDWYGKTWAPDEAEGYWNIHFPEEQTYNVTVHLYPQEKAGNITLKVAHATYTRYIPAGAKSIVIKNIQIPPGTHTLAGDVLHGKKITNPYQLELFRL